MCPAWRGEPRRRILDPKEYTLEGYQQGNEREIRKMQKFVQNTLHGYDLANRQPQQRCATRSIRQANHCFYDFFSLWSKKKKKDRLWLHTRL